MPGKIASAQVASKNSVAGFGRAVGAELLLVSGDVDLHCVVS